ncbi:MAG TPA: hypothetical protein VN671_10020 [Solirubrobacterales bacterium]|nr:hypothetical protein [Solirubrobacterales bacterium]
MTDSVSGEIQGGVQDPEASAGPVPKNLRHLREKERAQGILLRRLFAEQEHGLRQSYADWIIRVLGAQLFVADVIFVVFAWAGRDWELPSGVIEVWLAATVIQIVGVVAIVTRHLFPSRDRGEARA